MNWDAIGAIGEIIGAVGVIATLFYLAAQIRKNISWQKRQGFRDAVSNLKDAIARIGPNAHLYNSGCADYRSLDEDDRLHFHTLITEKYAAFELFYDFHESGDVKIEAIDGINRWMKSDFANRGVRDWWSDTGRETFSNDFSDIVDSVVSEAVIKFETQGLEKPLNDVRAGL